MFAFTALQPCKWLLLFAILLLGGCDEKGGREQLGVWAFSVHRQELKTMHPDIARSIVALVLSSARKIGTARMLVAAPWASLPKKNKPKKRGCRKTIVFGLETAS